MTEKVLQDYRLSDAEVQFFHENGYVGPFNLYSKEFIEKTWKRLKFELALSGKKPHNAKINYDRHLDIDFFSEHICREEIVQRVNSLIGDDVMCWRTEFFPKYPNEQGTHWHQEKTFQLEDNKPLLKFPRDGEYVPLEATVWTAFTDARREHGCLRFIPGSHKHEYYDDSKITLYGTTENHGVFGYDFKQKQADENWDPDQERHVEIELTAGQFIIFASRTVHGSLPNVSNQMRLGFTVRYLSPDVKVYDGVTELHEHGEVIDLSYAGCVLTSGVDRFGYNKRHTHNFNGREFKVI